MQLQITLTTAAANSLTVVSGGDNATNALAVKAIIWQLLSKLASISITGDKALSVTFKSATNGSVLETVDASNNMTGGLTMSMVNLKMVVNLFLVQVWMLLQLLLLQMLLLILRNQSKL